MKALCDFARDPAGHLRPRSKIAPHCDHAVEAPHARPRMLGHSIRSTISIAGGLLMRTARTALPTAQGGLHNESYKPSGSGRARRAGAACPSVLAAPLQCAACNG